MEIGKFYWKTFLKNTAVPLLLISCNSFLSLVSEVDLEGGAGGTPPSSIVIEAIETVLFFL